jgi:hypothetical protein
LPFTSVIVTMVLLNVDWMQAMPVATFFLTRFFVGLAFGPPALGGTLGFADAMTLCPFL